MCRTCRQTPEEEEEDEEEEEGAEEKANTKSRCVRNIMRGPLV